MAGKITDLKVIILGDTRVGMTSLFRRYIEGKFREDGQSNVAAAFYSRQWGPCKVAIWDTAGQEKYSSFSQFYCRSTGVVILPFDLTNVSTFESLRTKFSSILEAANEDCKRIVVGTKNDLIDAGTRQVTFDEGKQLSRELNESVVDMKSLPHDPYFETSSLLNDNVSQVFDYFLSGDIKKRQIAQSKRGTTKLMEVCGEKSRPKTKCCS